MSQSVVLHLVKNKQHQNMSTNPFETMTPVGEESLFRASSDHR